MTDQVNEALDYTPGELDRTAPERIWLQIDIGAGKDYRNEPFAADIDGVTWHNESIGGLEVQYVRADLAPHPARGVVDDRSPSYDALLIIVQSVCAALDRAGMEECDSPGEAIDVMREQYEAKIAALQAAALPAVPSVPEGMNAEAVGRVTWHIGKAIEYIEKQYPNGRTLDRGPIIRNMRRWHAQLLAATPKDQPAQGVDGA